MKKELEIPSAPENISMVESFIEDLKNEFEFKEDVFGNVMVATTEAVNNSIIHGNKGDESRTVFVSCENAGSYRLKVVVRDEGPGFNPDRLSDPTAPENIENPGGRGVFLMEHLSDELEFRDDGREVIMYFNI